MVSAVVESETQADHVCDAIRQSVQASKYDTGQIGKKSVFQRVIISEISNQRTRNPIHGEVSAVLKGIYRPNSQKPLYGFDRERACIGKPSDIDGTAIGTHQAVQSGFHPAPRLVNMNREPDCIAVVCYTARYALPDPCLCVSPETKPSGGVERLYGPHEANVSFLDHVIKV
jgi:hypothetical protein